MQETQVQFLGLEDPLKKKWQPAPVFLPGKTHGQRSLVVYNPWGCKIGHNLVTKPPPPEKWKASSVAQWLKNLLAMPKVQEMCVWSSGQEDSPGGGHGNPLQYSCLVNLMDWRASQPTVHMVAMSQTSLKWHLHWQMNFYLTLQIWHRHSILYNSH